MQLRLCAADNRGQERRQEGAGEGKRVLQQAPGCVYVPRCAADGDRSICRELPRPSLRRSFALSGSLDGAPMGRWLQITRKEGATVTIQAKQERRCRSRCRDSDGPTARRSRPMAQRRAFDQCSGAAGRSAPVIRCCQRVPGICCLPREYVMAVSTGARCLFAAVITTASATRDAKTSSAPRMFGMRGQFKLSRTRAPKAQTDC